MCVLYGLFVCMCARSELFSLRYVFLRFVFVTVFVRYVVCSLGFVFFTMCHFGACSLLFVSDMVFFVMVCIR